VAGVLYLACRAAIPLAAWTNGDHDVPGAEVPHTRQPSPGPGKDLARPGAAITARLAHSAGRRPT